MNRSECFHRKSSFVTFLSRVWVTFSAFCDKIIALPVLHCHGLNYTFKNVINVIKCCFIYVKDAIKISPLLKYYKNALSKEIVAGLELKEIGDYK